MSAVAVQNTVTGRGRRAASLICIQHLVYFWFKNGKREATKLASLQAESLQNPQYHTLPLPYHTLLLPYHTRAFFWVYHRKLALKSTI